MFRCWIENEYNQKIELTNNQDYKIYQIDGLEPPQAIINTSTVANFDGSRFNSSRTSERNLVIYLTIEGDCEANRINLYNYIKVKRPLRFYYRNSSRDVCIDGYVESMPIGFFDMKQTVQISIICPYPYFKQMDSTILDFVTVTPEFVFPFAYEQSGKPFSVMEVGAMQSLINGGDVQNGVVITLQASGQVLNPVVYNHTTGDFFKVGVEMTEGDEIKINTIPGQKGVTQTHDGVVTNIINKMYTGSTWLQLYTGDNIFSYGADEFAENLFCSFTHVNEFEGV